MELLLLDIVRTLRENPALDARGLSRIINVHSNRLPGDARFAKKQLMPYYLRVRESEPERWASWNIDDQTERRLLRLIQMKPRRTASGVATITVITKPWACTGSCLFCPADVRMPKSYLHAEPACQRAERNWFDPYLQVSARLRVLQQMGHATDKVEIIVLGGTFDDYPQAYRIWFVEEVFRALNDAAAANGETIALDSPVPDLEGEASTQPSWYDTTAQRARRYHDAGIANDEGELANQVKGLQEEVTAGRRSFNSAIDMLYRQDGPWAESARWQKATLEQLEYEHRRNESAACRCVGLVVETRPELATPENLTLLRRLGCTKVQMGVQTLNDDVIKCTGRTSGSAEAARTFGLLRLFGYKIHAHFMVNLPGATPEGDKADYLRFATENAYQPDEVKLYPCVLIGSAPLARELGKGIWHPYDEKTLVDVLAADVIATPPYTRISRMIRDFSAGDIVSGNKKTNLRQMVEARLKAADAPVREIRYREIGTDDVDARTLELEDIPYSTATTEEHFLQWVTPDGHIAGFLRLSLPHPREIAAWGESLPIGEGEAMIREVHVYGRVARLGENSGTSASAPAQHAGLGRRLVARAADIARDAGYTKLNVISSVGTRTYYESLGFQPAGLYQQLPLA